MQKGLKECRINGCGLDGNMKEYQVTKTILVS